MCSPDVRHRGLARLRTDRGQSTAEYVVLMGVVGGMAIAASSLLGTSLRAVLQQVAQRMLSAITGMPGTP